MDLKISRVVAQALTTPEYANLLRNVAHNKTLVEPGRQLLKRMLHGFAMEKGINDIDARLDIINIASSHTSLASIFDVLQSSYQFHVHITEKIERAGGITKKMKAEVVVSLLYATFFDQQEEVFWAILEEVKKRMIFDGFANDYLRFYALLQAKQEEQSVHSYLSSEKFSGTDDKPIFKAVLDYGGIKVEALGARKNEAKVKVCERWFKEKANQIK